MPTPAPWSGASAVPCGSGPAGLGELGVPVAGLDAVTAEECAAITERLAAGGPIYHAGGPGGG